VFYCRNCNYKVEVYPDYSFIIKVVISDTKAKCYVEKDVGDYLLDILLADLLELDEEDMWK
jgi:hypothetical protein